MANPEQLEILKQGVEVWNKWREENPDAVINLRRADLAGINLRKAKLRNADLKKVDLSDADLRGADLINANLKKANLKHTTLSFAYLSVANLSDTDLRNADLYNTHIPQANLINADLRGANLNKADLNEANLSGADFSNANLSDSKFVRSNFKGAQLSETDFTNGKLGGTIFGENDLSDSINLDTLLHYSPSTIGTDTIQKSKGKIPLEFLRGCGLSDLDIEYAKLANPSLDPEQVTDITYKIHQLYLGDGIRYYSCFISYSNKNQDFAQRLHNDLQDNGVRCWFAPEDIKIGDQIRPTIDRQIRLRDKLLVILSENSVKSEWVGDEVEAALEEESASGRLVLFPIRLDNAVMDTRDDWAAKIKRRRHIGDFSNWRDEGSYRKAFERLLRDLKANASEARK